MRILSIETSCDETGISILEAKKVGKTVSFSVLANVLNSQVKIHAEYGGVFPAMAKREHIKNLPILLEKALKIAKLGGSVATWRPNRQVDLITVTSGPGLEPALWTGIVFAKELAQKWNVPLMPANHMEGHIFSVFAEYKKTFTIPLLHQGSAGQAKMKFPALSLLVSGGHTELVLIKDFRKYQIIGETLDDAAGEAFDKVARMLELPYPGGPEVSKLAELERRRILLLGGLASTTVRARGIFQQKNIRASQEQCSSQSDRNNISSEFFRLPRPMIYSKNFDFSFSGLKTAVLYLIRDLKKENPDILKDEKIKQAIALEFENAVVETLIYKTKKAIEKYNIQTLIVAGGVSANKYLKFQMQKLAKGKQTLYFPNKKLSGDNALMIGIAGYFKYIDNNKKAPRPSSIKAEGGLRL